MRFRPRNTAFYALISLATLAFSAFAVYRSLHARHAPFALPLVFLVFVNLHQIFLTWTFEPTALVQRFFWSRREIPYAAITSVHIPRPGWIEIETAFPGSGLMSGRMLISPARLSDFVEALRTHAPHARFTL